VERASKGMLNPESKSVPRLGSDDSSKGMLNPESKSVPRLGSDDFPKSRLFVRLATNYTGKKETVLLSTIETRFRTR
jgi:hypothetical protein